jgi:hypothetical protein
LLELPPQLLSRIVVNAAETSPISALCCIPHAKNIPYPFR